jgi:hypothetical protein
VTVARTVPALLLEMVHPMIVALPLIEIAPSAAAALLLVMVHPMIVALPPIESAPVFCVARKCISEVGERASERVPRSPLPGLGGALEAN